MVPDDDASRTTRGRDHDVYSRGGVEWRASSCQLYVLFSLSIFLFRVSCHHRNTLSFFFSHPKIYHLLNVSCTFRQIIKATVMQVRNFQRPRATWQNFQFPIISLAKRTMPKRRKIVDLLVTIRIHWVKENTSSLCVKG